MEAPSPPDPVAIAECCCHRSRSGPVVEEGVGVFQTPVTGKYPSAIELPSHDRSQIPSTSFGQGSITVLDSVARNYTPHNDPSLFDNSDGHRAASTNYADQSQRRTPPTTSEQESPGRTHHGLLEAPNPSNSVVPRRQRQHSRPGPVVETGEGVFHRASPGKYLCLSTTSCIDTPSASSNYRSLLNSSHDLAAERPITADQIERRSSSSNELGTPGRTNYGLLEAPNPSNSVEPRRQRQHSRPGPVVVTGEGVFRTPVAGKYNAISNRPLPEMFDASRQSEPFSHAPTRHLYLTPSSSSLPGRTLAISHEEVPSPLITVESHLPATSSRPGPVLEMGEGVFRRPSAGKYDTSKSSSLPKVSSISRPNQRENLLLYYQNVGGINSSVEEYRLALSDQSYDIIIFVETWLNDDTLSSQVFGSGYEVFRCDRSVRNSRKSTGGGVLVAVKPNLNAKAVENSSWDCLEQVWTSIELGDRKLFLCALYIPPDRTRDVVYIESHCSSVFSILETASAVDEIIVFGDFNLPSISWKAAPIGYMYPDIDHSVLHTGAAKLLDSYSSATLLQISSIANENNRQLDLCFVSDMSTTLAVAPSPLVKLVAHHPPLFAKISHNLANDFSTPPVSVSYDFHKADHRGLAAFFSTLDWGSTLDLEDVESAAQTFCNILAYATDRYVPKRVHKQQSGPPWQTSTLRRLKTIKRAALRRFTKYRTLPLKNHYVRLNHEYKRVSQGCYHRYQRNIQRKLKSNPKSFWKYVNEQRKESGLPSSMTFNGITANTSQEICLLFAEKFGNVFSNEELSEDQIGEAVSNVPLSGQTLGLIDIDAEMIISASSKLKSSFNPGPDGFPSALLKRHIDDLLSPLLDIFRASMARGTFPSCWNSAHMFPVHKKGNKRDVNNYRGITSLSAVYKLFELVVEEPVQAHCKQYLSTDQHGFTSGRSTASNLLCLTSYITESMVLRAQTDVIYTDLSAAFDKVNHDIVIAKLERFGINGSLLRWFRSYLTGRELMVVIGDSQAPRFSSTSGIPQGSHLGPLIFLLYFNDVHLVLKVPRLSFADDLKLFLLIRSVADCRFLQEQLQVFANWCSSNRMMVNPSKCSVVTFSRRRDPISFAYYLSDTEIERSSHVKDLGVILDSQLTFKQHVSYVVDKASRSLGCIFRIAKNFTDIDCLKSLYCSLSRSILEYCSEVWSPNYNNGVERIESVQRRFLRYALRRLPWRDPLRLPSYVDRCRLIHLEPLYARRDTARALYIAGALQGRLDCPAILEQININVAPRSLRNNLMLRLPFRRTNYSMHGAIVGLQRVFNRVASIFDFNLSRQTLRQRFSNFFFGFLNNGR